MFVLHPAPNSPEVRIGELLTKAAMVALGHGWEPEHFIDHYFWDIRLLAAQHQVDDETLVEYLDNFMEFSSVGYRLMQRGKAH